MRVTLHLVKYQKGVDKGGGSVWGILFPLPAGQYWSLTEAGDGNSGSYRNCPQIRVVERCWGLLGKEHLLSGGLVKVGQTREEEATE